MISIYIYLIFPGFQLLSAMTGGCYISYIHFIFWLAPYWSSPDMGFRGRNLFRICSLAIGLPGSIGPLARGEWLAHQERNMALTVAFLLRFSMGWFRSLCSPQSGELIPCL